MAPKNVVVFYFSRDSAYQKRNKKLPEAKERGGWMVALCSVKLLVYIEKNNQSTKKKIPKRTREYVGDKA